MQRLGHGAQDIRELLSYPDRSNSHFGEMWWLPTHGLLLDTFQLYRAMCHCVASELGRTVKETVSKKYQSQKQELETSEGILCAYGLHPETQDYGSKIMQVWEQMIIFICLSSVQGQCHYFSLSQANWPWELPGTSGMADGKKRSQKTRYCLWISGIVNGSDPFYWTP